MPKAPKRRNPSATKVVDDMVSRINGEFSESTYQSPNKEISNVTNISHKYSSPSTSPRPKSDSEIEIAEKSKIMVRSDMLSRSISLEEDQDLPYP